MAGAGRLHDLDLSAEEAERLQRAFRDERFRALFAEYAAELTDPEQRRLYEEEVAALERQRGVEVRFVHPTPGFVLRTSQEGSRRCYINVCSNALMGEPRSRAERGGQRWELPYSLAPGREELRPGGRRRLLYDVVFHPAALRLAARSARFRRLLCDTALEAVESRCGVRLDRNNATVLRGVSYKGDYRHCRDSAPSPVPRELVVTVELPLLRSAEQAELEIRGRELRLDSQRPAYRLRLLLPYDVDESGGRAAFNRAQRQLQVTLPVVLPPGPREPPGPAGERLKAAEPVAQRSEEAGPAEEGGGAAPPPELGPGGAVRSTCGGGEPGDPPAEPPAEALCDPPAAPSAQPLAEAAAELPVEPLCDPPAEPAGEPPVDPTSEPFADSPAEPPAEPATDPTSEPPAGPTTDPRSDPFTEPATDPPAEPLTEPPDPPLPCCGAAPPIASPEPAMPSGDTPPLAPEGHPGEVCPPFRARQDEASLTLLLLVPGIQPQSLHGDVGTHHYSLRFCTDAAAFALFLRFPPAAALVSPESSVSVSAHNAVVGLAKAPGSTGLWDKFSFGLDPSALQVQRLPRALVESPSLEMLKKPEDVALENMVQW
ncbi:hypothetical protein DUI87_24713 [Hirundo rustica rustica]|uniref:PIH1 N-terminal domain-containing protein n=1 Tax=Hirundo rustica rustica TaxID=333673 RepID=A0A3M0JID5_HIRRU|nr:hypothetical protein DUI87_24713 [Hirundo rustica rustica]